MYCKKCGKEINGDSLFCKYCGTDVSKKPSDSDNINSTNIKTNKTCMSILIVCVMFYILLIYPLTYKINFMGIPLNIELTYNPVKLEMSVKIGSISYTQQNIDWIQAIKLRYRLISGNSSDFQNYYNNYSSANQKPVKKDLLYEKAENNFLEIQELQNSYTLKNFFKSNTDKEKAFLKLYEGYIKSYDNISQYSYKNDINISDQYAEQNKAQYKKIGLAFNKAEGTNYLVIDYSVLMKTIGIPRNWKEWLTIQQKNNEKRIKIRMGNGFEGESLTDQDVENAIIELEKIESKSGIIKSIQTKQYMYIPNTSKSLLWNYLMGSELSPRFDYMTGELRPNLKISYKHFIDNYPKSKYYKLINEYYSKLEKSNFKNSYVNRDWLNKEIEKY